jgi:hypothetical protein
MPLIRINAAEVSSIQPRLSAMRLLCVRFTGVCDELLLKENY